MLCASRLDLLRDRASMLSRSRAFFLERKVLEVDCPLIAPSAIDAAINPIPITYSGSEQHYLITSPEFRMKALLVEGIGDCYQLCHVFRDGEKGQRHHPEFTIVEWYRCGFSFDEMIEETQDFCELFIGPQRRETRSYPEVFRDYAGVAYDAEIPELLQALERHGITPYKDWALEGAAALKDLLFGIVVEPELGKNALTALVNFPKEKAELARTVERDGKMVAERFELYFKGYELANGYGELKDPVEHRQRFEQANQKRQQVGKAAIPLDEDFLQALERGLPDCCGVAVGFDRLMMLRHKAQAICEILP